MSYIDDVAKALLKNSDSVISSASRELAEAAAKNADNLALSVAKNSDNLLRSALKDLTPDQFRVATRGLAESATNFPTSLINNLDVVNIPPSFFRNLDTVSLRTLNLAKLSANQLDEISPMVIKNLGVDDFAKITGKTWSELSENFMKNIPEDKLTASIIDSMPTGTIAKLGKTLKELDPDVILTSKNLGPLAKADLDDLADINKALTKNMDNAHPVIKEAVDIVDVGPVKRGVSEKTWDAFKSLKEHKKLIFAGITAAFLTGVGISAAIKGKSFYEELTGTIEKVVDPVTGTAGAVAQGVVNSILKALGLEGWGESLNKYGFYIIVVIVFFIIYGALNK